MPMSSLEPGSRPPRPLRVVATKWPDRPHWEYDAVQLGEDDLGVWVGAPVGTSMTRPGAAFRTDQAQVSLVPREAPFVATFYAPGGTAHCDVYVDITTVPVWDDETVTAVDLDLDVVRGWTGRVWVDDEDEFAAHRVEHAYPRDLVRLAATSCDAVRDAVSSRRPPYDGLHPRTWFDALDALVARP